VAVLAILAVLGLVVGQQVVQKLKRTQQQNEGANLEAIADAYKHYVSRIMRLPAATAWASIAAADLGQPLSTVQLNRSGYARVFVSDPNLSIPTRFLGSINLATTPYVQDVNGVTNFPINPRLMVISCLTRPVPAVSGSAFNDIWNTPRDQVPANWLAADATWANQGEEVKVQRLDLRGLFHRLILNNLDSSLVAVYSLGNSATPVSNFSGTNYIAVSAPPVEVWYLDGTLLNLRFADTTLQAAEFIHADASYFFEHGYWHLGGPSSYGGGTSELGVFGRLVTNFLATPYPAEDPNQFGSSQQAVIDEFYTYLWTYGVWALEGFPKGGSATAQQVPSFRTVFESQARLETFSANVLKK